MRYFSSDQHFGHENIIRFCARPYANAGEMGHDLVRRWNEVVGPDDEIWVLGDVAMKKGLEGMRPLHQAHGVKLLVPGNHDKCWAPKRKGDDPDADYEAVGFTVKGSSEFLTIAGRHVELCHFPFASIPEYGSEDSGYVDKFAAYRPADRGQWLLCGHIHERWRQRGRAINVGVDAWGGYPVSEEVIAELIAAGPADREPLAW